MHQGPALCNAAESDFIANFVEHHLLNLSLIVVEGFINLPVLIGKNVCQESHYMHESVPSIANRHD